MMKKIFIILLLSISSVAFCQKQEKAPKTGNTLQQNVPNPFNASTEIKYTLISDSPVKLTIHNLMGEKVAELVNEPQVAGEHTLVFDASTLSTGMYFYKMETNTGILMKKMILIK